MLNSNKLLQGIKALTPSKKLLIAFSGGLDSYVLLHALVQANNTAQYFHIRAIHVNHGLQKISLQWAEQCSRISKHLNIDCEVISLQLSIPKGESLEAVAREARYHAFKQSLQADEVLLTAQHQDDQAETLLIQLFRGAGVNGLAAMPQLSSFGKGQHLRPLLNTTRLSLEAYAKQYALDFIEDPSNQDQRFDRNYLRHEIVPRLKQRWSAVNKVLSRVASHQAEVKHLLTEYLEQDLSLLSGKRTKTLSIVKLKALSSARCKAVIRYFIDKHLFLAPSEKKLQHIMSDVLNAKPDAVPCVHWKDAEVRRYQDDLYILAPPSEHDASQRITWDSRDDLYLPSLKRILKVDLLSDIKVDHKEKVVFVEVRFRQGGEKIYQHHRNRTVTLKKLFQEMSIPPWERDRIPLIYMDDKLVAIGFD
ncbi:MAG: tRNA lysidine(34) synthetase TilS [Aquificaceae bacterium]|nr:MAG: tRNA lysidine(34) synthetase TilS [Aquificaceae bacterium]